MLTRRISTAKTMVTAAMKTMEDKKCHANRSRTLTRMILIYSADVRQQWMMS